MTHPAAYTAPHETDELWPFVAEVNGTPTLVGVEACVLPKGQRPTEDAWLPAVVRDQATLVRLVGHPRGWVRVWSRTTRDDEEAVVEHEPAIFLT